MKRSDRPWNSLPQEGWSHWDVVTYHGTKLSPTGWISGPFHFGLWLWFNWKSLTSVVDYRMYASQILIVGESSSELLKLWILGPHSQRFCFIRSVCCLRIFMFTTFPGWFWCTCVVNSILKTNELGPPWEDSQSYSKYICAFLFVPYPHSNSPFCPITRVPFYLQRGIMFGGGDI